MTEEQFNEMVASMAAQSASYRTSAQVAHDRANQVRAEMATANPMDYQTVKQTCRKQ